MLQVLIVTKRVKKSFCVKTEGSTNLSLTVRLSDQHTTKFHISLLRDTHVPILLDSNLQTALDPRYKIRVINGCDTSAVADYASWLVQN